MKYLWATVTLTILMSGNPFPEPYPKAARRIARQLDNEAQKRCTGAEIYVSGEPMLTCYHADAACWWRAHRYHNYKCWNTYFMYYRIPGDKNPWLFCIRAAWGNQLGRVTRRQKWECVWQAVGPPSFESIRRG